MNGPKKIVSKLPTLFNKPATVNSNSNEPSTSNEGTVKRPTVLSTRNLRRSRSAYDIPSRPFSRPLVAPSFTSTAKKPTKRPGTTLNGETKLSANKRTKPVENVQNVAPKTTNRPKAAPYDFKTKFNYVKEDYDKLKIAHRELKDKHVSVADQNEELVTKNENLQNELDATKENYKTVKTELDKIKANYDGLVDSNTNLQTANESLRNNLEITTKHLNMNTQELEFLKREHELTKENLSFSNKALDQSKILIETLKEQLYAFEKKQREMHNVIQELKGNIRVFCRIRPPLTEEKHKILYDVNYVDEKTIELLKNEKKCEFSFDKVFGPNAMQEDIFEELSQLVQSALDGYNVCIFAYGQTGSGKTYTMDGIRSSASELGMIPRSVDLIFLVIEQLQKLGWAYVIKTSFLEIYNENIVDLLEPRKSQLDIRMVDTKSNDVYVTNLSVIEVENADELKYHLHIAQKNRATAATENNERSSRSHSVTKIILEGFNKNRNERCSGSLNLVDLAGSEKFYTNETTRLRETTNINKSLSNLSNVILALVRKTTHVPYRNSKLTHLLMPCLGGNSKTLMLVNISPLEECYHESVNSLRFATTVNQCKTGSIKKIKTLQLNERGGGLRSENSFCK